MSDRRRATYDDVLAAPEHKVAEIVDGDLFLSPRPAPRHAVATVQIISHLCEPFDRGRGGPGGWRILVEPELHFGEDVLVPDIAGWRRERLPAIPDEAWFTLAPDWVAEVVSPSTERLDRGRKLRVYARAGIEHAWLVNPLARTLEVYRRSGETWLLVAACEGEAPVRAEPFAAITLALGELWA